MKKMSPTKRMRELNNKIGPAGWFVLEPMVDDFWCLYSGTEGFLCWFEFSKCPETLKHWLLIGLTSTHWVEVGNLPNWEKYKDFIPWKAPSPSPENYFSLIKINDYIRLRAPTRLIKQIKPLLRNLK